MNIKGAGTPAKITIVSGFLGAGKSTFIHKLLTEMDSNEKVILIENDFGEISIDATLFQSHGVQVKEINSGCICCTLSGDFIKALKDVITQFHPDRILIEPSGVGKLSDVVNACSDPAILPLAEIDCRIAVADVKRCKMYLDNFGEFFEDQIEHADIILLSRTEAFPDKIQEASALLHSLNEHAEIIAAPWEQWSAAQLLRDSTSHEKVIPCHDDECACGCGHSHHGEDGHECTCGHNHTAEDAFDTVTIQTRQIFSPADLAARIEELNNTAGTILRAKGIVQGEKSSLNIQYVPGDIRVTECETAGDTLCIIGQNLDQDALSRAFNRG